MTVKISKKEAWGFAEKQLDSKTLISKKKGNQWPCWHYGRCEIQELLDEIYGRDEDGD